MAKKKGRTDRRYKLTDDRYKRMEGLLPRQHHGGKRADHRTVLNGMFWVLNSGSHSEAEAGHTGFPAHLSPILSPE